MSTAEGVDQAVAHLAALGHRGLTYVDTAPAPMFTGVDRRRNAEASCVRAGVALTTVGPFSPSFGSGVRAADLVIARGSTARLSDQMALGVVRRLTERGSRVGADVGVVGVDDIGITAVRAVRRGGRGRHGASRRGNRATPHRRGHHRVPRRPAHRTDRPASTGPAPDGETP